MWLKGALLVFALGLTSARHFKTSYRALRENDQEGFALKHNRELFRTLLSREEAETENTVPNNDETAGEGEGENEVDNGSPNGSTTLKLEQGSTTSGSSGSTAIGIEGSTAVGTDGSTTASVAGSTTAKAAQETIKPPITEIEAYTMVEAVLSTMTQNSPNNQDLLYMIVREISYDSLSNILGEFVHELLKEGDSCRGRILIDVVTGGIHFFAEMESAQGDEDNLRHLVEEFVVDNPSTNIGKDISVEEFTQKLVEIMFQPVYDFTYNILEPKLGLESTVMFTEIHEFLLQEPTPDFTLNELLLHVGMVAIVTTQDLGNLDCDLITTPDVYSYLKTEATKSEQELRLLLDTLETSGLIETIDPVLSQDEITTLVQLIRTQYTERTDALFEYLLAFEETGVDKFEMHLMDVAGDLFERFLVYEVESNMIEKLVQVVRVTIEEEIEKCGLFKGVPVSSVKRDQLKLILKLVFERVLREGTDQCIDTVLIRMVAGLAKDREYTINWDFEYFIQVCEALEVELLQALPDIPMSRLAVLSFRLVKEMLSEHFADLYRNIEAIGGRSMSEMYYPEMRHLGDQDNSDMALDTFVEEIVRQALYAAEVPDMSVCVVGSQAYPEVATYLTDMLEEVSTIDKDKIEYMTKETLELYDTSVLAAISDFTKTYLEDLFEPEVAEVTVLRDRIVNEGQYGTMDELIDYTIEILLGVLPEEDTEKVDRRHHISSEESTESPEPDRRHHISSEESTESP